MTGTTALRRERLKLIKLLWRALRVNLRGTTYEYPIGFLEDVFGGAVRALGHEQVTKRLQLVDDQDNTADTVRKLMKAAAVKPENRG